MSVKIYYKNGFIKKNLSNIILFLDENFNISALKKHISNTDYSFIADLLKNKDKKDKILSFDLSSKRKIILVDKNYIRPLDVNTLLGNAAKARRELKWKPQINIHTLIDEMITEEMNILSNDQ